MESTNNLKKRDESCTQQTEWKVGDVKKQLPIFTRSQTLIVLQTT